MNDWMATDFDGLPGNLVDVDAVTDDGSFTRLAFYDYDAKRWFNGNFDKPIKSTVVLWRTHEEELCKQSN